MYFSLKLPRAIYNIVKIRIFRACGIYLFTGIYFIFLTLDINSTENYNLDTCLEGIRILKYVPLSVGSAQGDFFIRLPIPFPFHIPRKFFHQTMVLLEKHPNLQDDPILLHSIKRML